MSKRPDFFIVGAPKCGTTSLYNWLKDHPDIFMPVEKEPHYFAQHLSNRYCRVRDEAQYLALFDTAQDHQICGEASVLYGFYKKSVEQILAFNPSAKIIYMMRNPIDMAQSYHGQLLVNLEEDIDNFEGAWRLQAQRQKGAALPKTSTDADLLQYGHICSLGAHLKDIADLVPAEQLHIILLEDLAKEPKEIYQKVLMFLKVKKDDRQVFKKSNEAAAVRFTFLQRLKTSELKILIHLKAFLKTILFDKLIEKLNRTKKSRKKISLKLLKELQQFFDKDIKITEEILERDLTHWKNHD